VFERGTGCPIVLGSAGRSANAGAIGGSIKKWALVGVLPNLEA